MKGLVYKIVHNQSNICYVGSTLNTLSQRWQQHKQSYNKWLNGKGDCIAIYPHFKEYGIENFKIILIKEYEVMDRRHLETKEQLWISKLKSCNTNNPIELPLQKHYMKIYTTRNKEHLREVDRRYREKHLAQIKTRESKRYTCECGTTVRIYGKPRHQRSTRHKQWLETGNQTIYSRGLVKY